MKFDIRHGAARCWQRESRGNLRFEGGLPQSKLILSYSLFTLIAIEIDQNLKTAGQGKALLARNVANHLFTNESLIFPNNEAHTVGNRVMGTLLKQDASSSRI